MKSFQLTLMEERQPVVLEEIEFDYQKESYSSAIFCNFGL